MELLLARSTGYRILHIHWVFGFNFPFTRRFPAIRRLGRLWLNLVLRWSRVLGFGVVWTAHNVLPHTQVFDDDVRGRRLLVRMCDVVLAHSPAARAGLKEIGVRPLRFAIMPIGPAEGGEDLAALAAPSGAAPPVIVFFGRVSPYKGLEELLQVAAQLGGVVRIVVAGACTDPALEKRLIQLAAPQPHVTLRLEFLREEELRDLLSAADACVFPFRRVTTSSSVLHALSAGRLAIVPDLPAFSELLDDGVLTYPPGLDGLRNALARVATMPAAEFRARGTAARRMAASADWSSIGLETIRAYDRALIGRSAHS
jgi:glycosyltransferase involved in cell wall biosynthesis